MRISDWSSDVCSSDLPQADISLTAWYSVAPGWTLFGGPDFPVKDTDDPVDSYDQGGVRLGLNKSFGTNASLLLIGSYRYRRYRAFSELFAEQRQDDQFNATAIARFPALKFAGLVPEIVAQHTHIESNIDRSEEHTSELKSLMRISYAVFCLKKK